MSLVKANSLQLGQSVTATNNFTWYQPSTPDGTVRLGNGNSGSVTDLVTLTSAGNLGIGTSSPGYKLQVVGGASSTKAAFGSATNPLSAWFYSVDGGETDLLLGATAANHTSANIIAQQAIPLCFYTSNSERMRLDASGNLGLNVTPSGWASSYKALQIGAGASLASTGAYTLLGQNYYNDGALKYIATGAASYYQQISGAHSWYTAPSGTAGSAISFTQAMTLDASGNLQLNVGEYIRITGTTISVGTSATAITGVHSFGSTAIVRGISGGQIFGDLVFFSDSVVTVLASHGVSGGPAARTYTAVGGVLKLAMASGTYSVNVGITTVV